MLGAQQTQWECLIGLELKNLGCSTRPPVLWGVVGGVEVGREYEIEADRQQR